MTCGFPTLSQSKKIFNEMLSHKPDIIEFGLPFSDPMADGPIIQEAVSYTHLTLPTRLLV